MREFDLIVIGGGTGGLRVARACRKAGWRVALVDELPLGGTCALRGCDPKKMLVGVTEAADWVQRLRGKGLESERLGVDWADLMAFKRSFTDAMPPRVEKGLIAAEIEVLHGSAQFVGTDVLRVGEEELRANHFHLATGARPRTLGIPGQEHVATSTDFLELPELPKRLVFIGGGFISFEFAHVARRAGAEAVTILHRSARALREFDPDLVDRVVERTRALGIDVRLDWPVESVEEADGLLTVRGTNDAVEADYVVHGAGRVPNVDRLGLDAAGVEVSPRGIRVTEFMRSVSNPTVFAAGDCADTPTPNLTPVSSFEARIAAKNLIAGRDAHPAEYPAFPSVVFTVPALARVGLLEADARAQGLDFEIHELDTSGWYSSLRVAEAYTGFKVLTEKGSGRILGAHLLGPGAEEQVNLISMAIRGGLTANQLKGVPFAYPSYASDLGSMM